MNKDISLHEFDLSLLRGGPLYSLLVRAGIARPGARGMIVRIVILVALTWVPLAIITSSQGTFISSAIKIPFFYDLMEECRFLIALPLLIVAEGMVEPWLAHVLTHCRRLVADADAEKFKQFLELAVRRRDSLAAEVILVVIAFVRPHLGDFMLYEGLSSWRTVLGGSEPSTAYLWYLYVAKPLIMLAWLGWLWKYIIWGQLIVRVSTLPLRVIPTHPDKMGGLGFIAVGQAKFAILAFIFAAQISSFIGSEIAFHGAKLYAYRYLILAVVVLVLVIFLPPLFAFTPKLQDCKRRGLLEYGALADQYTTSFHQKWIEGKREDSEPLIGSSDIQSLADLAQGFEIVQSMKAVVMTRATIMSFVISTLIPFTPLLLTVYPFDELLSRLWKMVI